MAYSWEHFPDTTPDFGSAILESIEVLRRFPYLGAVVPRQKGVRVLIHTPILIFYHVWEDDQVVEIRDIRHSSRR